MIPIECLFGRNGEPMMKPQQDCERTITQHAAGQFPTSLLPLQNGFNAEESENGHIRKIVVPNLSAHADQRRHRGSAHNISGPDLKSSPPPSGERQNTDDREINAALIPQEQGMFALYVVANINRQ